MLRKERHVLHITRGTVTALYQLNNEKKNGKEGRKSLLYLFPKKKHEIQCSLDIDSAIPVTYTNNKYKTKDSIPNGIFQERRW